MSTVGLIGLGAMGSGMAASLRRAGHSVQVFDVRREVAAAFAQNGGVGNLAFGVKHGNEAPHNEVVNALFIGANARRCHTCRNNSVVIRDFFVVEDLLRFFDGFACKGFCKALVVAEPREDAWNFGMEVFRKVGGVYARVGHEFFLVKTLHLVERFFGRVSVVAVAVYL